MSSSHDLALHAAMDRIKWEKYPVEPKDKTVLHATHEGVFDFGDIKIRVYQLNDGQRVFDAEDVEKFFGIPKPR